MLIIDILVAWIYCWLGYGWWKGLQVRSLGTSHVTLGFLHPHSTHPRNDGPSIPLDLVPHVIIVDVLQELFCLLTVADNGPGYGPSKQKQGK